jgi:hypothetical protein
LLTLAQEGEEFSLDPLATEDLRDEAQILGCVDALLEGLVGEVADEVRSLLHLLLRTLALHSSTIIKFKYDCLGKGREMTDRQGTSVKDRKSGKKKGGKGH